MKVNIASVECQFCIIYGSVSDGDGYHVGGMVLKDELSIRAMKIHVFYHPICIGHNFCNIVFVIFHHMISPHSTKSGTWVTRYLPQSKESFPYLEMYQVVEGLGSGIEKAELPYEYCRKSTSF